MALCYDHIMNRKCNVCKLTKVIDDFFPSSKYKGKQYYRGECKECTKLELRSESGQKSQEKYRKSEKGKIAKSSYKKRREYRIQQTEYEMTRYYKDPLYRCKRVLRARLTSALDAKQWTKRSKFKQYIGCSLEELKVHLESLFTEGMTWENQGKWHIDHIVPLSSAKTEEEMYKLCHYTNLQPLWALDNIKKSNKIK